MLHIDACYASSVQVHIVLRGLLERVQTPVRYGNQLINCDNQMLLGKGEMDKRSESWEDTFSCSQVTGQR